MLSLPVETVAYAATAITAIAISIFVPLLVAICKLLDFLLKPWKFGR
ncbi:hypothetical protein PSE_2031 [Pseudovibrio sp. FO-BEG1]|nr:hypothetical protein PSE_2031 [Pseudovibrio sp. FO-BEG1]